MTQRSFTQTLPLPTRAAVAAVVVALGALAWSAAGHASHDAVDQALVALDKAPAAAAVHHYAKAPGPSRS